MIELANPANPLGLNERQAEVLDSLLRTGCNLETAQELGVSKTSVAEHVLRACRKAGAKNRTLLLLKWAEFRAGRAL